MIAVELSGTRAGVKASGGGRVRGQVGIMVAVMITVTGTDTVGLLALI